MCAKPGHKTRPPQWAWPESSGTQQPRATCQTRPSLLAGPISTPGLTHSTLPTPSLMSSHSDSTASGGCQQQSLLLGLTQEALQLMPTGREARPSAFLFNKKLRVTSVAGLHLQQEVPAWAPGQCPSLWSPRSLFSPISRVGDKDTVGMQWGDTSNTLPWGSSRVVSAVSVH